MIRKAFSHSSKFGRSRAQDYEPLENQVGDNLIEQLESAHTNSYCDQGEALARKMQNQLGFCNGSNFRVVSVADGSVSWAFKLFKQLKLLLILN